MMKKISVETATIINGVVGPQYDYEDAINIPFGVTKIDLSSTIEKKVTKAAISEALEDDVSLNKEFIDLFINRIDWDKFSEYHSTHDHSLFETYKDKINWNIISRDSYVDESFVRKFHDKLDFALLRDNLDADIDDETFDEIESDYNDEESVHSEDEDSIASEPETLSKSDYTYINNASKDTKKKEEGSNIMSKIVSTTKSDFKKAGYRTASKKMIEGFNATLVKLLEQKSYSNEHIALVQSFLKTEAGRAVSSTILGMALTYIPIPQIQENEHVQIIAEEFRIKAMETVQTEIVDVVIQNFLPMVLEALKYLPQDEVDSGSESPQITEGSVRIDSGIKSKVKATA